MHSVTSAPCRIDDVTIGCACVDRRGASRDERPSIFCHSLIHPQHDSRDPDRALDPTYETSDVSLFLCYSC